MSREAPASHFLDVGGLRRHYVDWGGDGRPAVFFHATGFHARMWDPVARRLRDRLRIVAFDARGHGRSDKPSSGYDWSVFVADAIGALDALGLDGVIGVGHSFGATSIACAAAQRADLFERLVLVDPVLIPKEWRTGGVAQSALAERTRRRRDVWPSREAVLESYRGRPPFDTWTEEALRLYVEHGTVEREDGSVELACPKAVEAEIFEGGRRYDALGQLDRVAVPTLLLQGERSPTLPDPVAAAARDLLRRGRVVTIPETTHFVLMERPDAIAEEILRFLDCDDAGEESSVMTTGLRHLALNVRNLEAVRDFYAETFGMRVVWQPDPDNVYLSSGRDNLALHRVSSNGSPLDHLGFFVESRDAVFSAADRLRRRGVELHHEERDHRDGSSSFYLRDPEGNVVQILFVPDRLPS